MIGGCAPRSASPGWFVSSTPSRCRSTTPPPMARRSSCSRARSPIPTGPTDHCSSSSRAAPDLKRHDRRVALDRPAGSTERSPTTGYCCWTSAARAAQRRSAGSRAWTPTAQAEYLTHFRADSIVRDAEFIRRALEVDRWSVLGQSFGGFCVLAYLSIAPDGLREAFFTGGLPPLSRPIDEIYARTYARVLERNRRFYASFPGRSRAGAAAAHGGRGRRRRAPGRRPADLASDAPAGADARHE